MLWQVCLRRKTFLTTDPGLFPYALGIFTVSSVATHPILGCTKIFQKPWELLKPDVCKYHKTKSWDEEKANSRGSTNESVQGLDKIFI